MVRNVKVGLFLLIGLIVAGILIFLVGDERHMFQRHATLHTTFNDVAGLKVGSPVRMGGLDVGQVETITFGTSDSDRRIHVTFTMISDQLQRIRSDSRVSIASKGLLGLYVVALVFTRPFSPLRVEGVLRRALPIIERNVTELPPLDPEPMEGRVVPMRP